MLSERLNLTENSSLSLALPDKLQNSNTNP